MHFMPNYAVWGWTEGSKGDEDRKPFSQPLARTHTHIQQPASSPYLYVYLLIDPICAYLICPPHLSVSNYLCISHWVFLYLSGHESVMDRSLHSNYSISLITLSQVGQAINALAQMDPATLTANARASCCSTTGWMSDVSSRRSVKPPQ